MKTRTPADIDYDLKILRGILLDTVQGTQKRLTALIHIDKLLDERLAVVDKEQKITDGEG
jgi:hypothetical protein